MSYLGCAGCDSSYYRRVTLNAHLPRHAPLNRSLLCAPFWTVTVPSRRTGQDIRPPRKETCVKRLTLFKVMYRRGCQVLGVLYGCHTFGCPTKPQASSSAETAEFLIKSPTFPLISSTQTTPSPFLNEHYQTSSRHPIHPGLKHSHAPRLQAARSFTPVMIKPRTKISHLVPVSSK